jgi:hypothetical protein
MGGVNEQGGGGTPAPAAFRRHDGKIHVLIGRATTEEDGCEVIVHRDPSGRLMVTRAATWHGSLHEEGLDGRARRIPRYARLENADCAKALTHAMETT